MGYEDVPWHIRVAQKHLWNQYFLIKHEGHSFNSNQNLLELFNADTIPEVPILSLATLITHILCSEM